MVSSLREESLNVDWGESHYIGPQQPEAGIPAGAEKWITGHDHEPWQEICKYFIHLYKYGKVPDIDVPPLSQLLLSAIRSHALLG
jgi:hypothetical protein